MTSKNALTRSKKRQAVELLRSNRLLEAKALCERICHTDRRDAEAWYMLGATHQQLNELDRAAACYSQVVVLKPDHAEAHYYLGNVLAEQGRLDEAESSFREALKHRPDYPEAWRNLATIFQRRNQFAEAAESYHRALQYLPRDAELCYNLGNALLDLEKFDEADRAFRTAIKLDPRFSRALVGLGLALKKRGYVDEAIRSYRQALEIDPAQFEAISNLGNALVDAGRFADAIAYHRQAIEIQPHSAVAQANLGGALAPAGYLQEAITYFWRAVKTHPDPALVYNALAAALADQGKLEEAVSTHRKAIELRPDSPVFHDNLLMALNYRCDDPGELYAEHLRWAERYVLHPSAIPQHDNMPDPARRLHIGYVSPDFRTHSVGYFIEPVLANHDPVQVEIYCYSDLGRLGRPDATTARLKDHVTQWHDIHGKSNEQVAELIRADGIDILVDLAGHTGYNRLPVFAHKPAPVQATYLGYPNTTGLPAMDYRLTDALADPPEQETFHTEVLVRLPTGFLCYQPPLDAPAVVPPPAQQAGHVTFGCFNVLQKIRPEAIKLWARLLGVVPGARLLLKNKSFRDSSTCERYYREFEEAGVPRDRLELVGWVPSRADHVALYNRIDIALDTFPYNGTTTTCEALWMGVPVITLEGNRHAARVGVSLLTQVGLTELIAKTPEDYVHMAVELAKDLDRLAALRAGLRERMRSSPLCNARTFTRNLENAYREMWRKWCSEQRTATS